MKQTPFNKYLPYFKDRYTFELCQVDHIDAVVAFIDTYWKKDHIFVRSPELLSWQHYDREKNRYNFVIAKHKETGEIHAMVGVTLTSHFDPEIEESVRWGSMWKIRPDIDEPGLGLMVEWMKNEVGRACAEVGFGESKIAIGLAKKLKAVTGIADHYVIINPMKTTFSIASIGDHTVFYSSQAAPSNKVLSSLSLEEYRQLEGPVIRTIPSYKSKLYYENRYHHHPVYTYQATRICNTVSDVVGILFWRKCTQESATCIRIVDYFGLADALCGCLEGFLELLAEQDAEYIDFIHVGMPGEVLEAGGFINRRDYPSMIIPNFFEPFVQRNIDVTYSYESTDPKYVPLIFKGDSDQDRPS
ncbi:hypothetical protein [Paenibacillus radicis (ex Gao et al. 2016)]|uniref:N-acetyltransferase domain-containing protein n=1 Tax=Paenibacillus radicis (ex Gao et al. 2016) TaxID=1737354 RepID=A0A917H9I3_9BACL|nr:hypothetical protein [Paenibacillus radicis (ex Gao et al. 2016)]GGG71962.1 hypothetical protein GCM10010918_29520 [Paenibacillus radicis (ex Gao et al. 2016)]